ncbi:uncharacterized protein LOC113497571 [Trichoplusia ni]|uniref:Uncharacterized protein LOC113497571 n=1 Tax=Trichoplusia ni TaxID=7111 RepID=A0A7E5VX94_TRINI|nr:uncharacterized protein LOC113497571 [Trichoplusia ni]
MFLLLILYFLCVYKTSALLCYNGTFTCRRYGEDPLQFRSLFTPSRSSAAKTRCLFTTQCNLRAENAMCFVRSWSARARHAWIVQRGCYLPTVDDHLPRSMLIPTRAMTCKHERHPEAEYKVCLCQADWCNSAPSTIPSMTQSFVKWSTYIIGSLILF